MEYGQVNLFHRMEYFREEIRVNSTMFILMVQEIV